MLSFTVLALVSVFAGGPIPVTCDAARADDDGYAIIVNGRGESIALRAPLCAAANRFSLSPVLPAGDTTDYDSEPSQRAWSVAALLHEANHIEDPTRTEAATNCAALSEIPAFASALGATQKTARRMQTIARFWMNRQSAPYRSRCTDGTAVTIRTQPGFTPRSH